MLLAVLLMAAGWVSYTGLPVDAFPDVSPNLVQIFTLTEGLAPEEIETYVTFRPLAATVAMAMVGSLIFALVIAPVLALLLMRRPGRAGRRFGERAVSRLRSAYDPLLRAFVSRRKLAVATALTLLVLPSIYRWFAPRCEARL